MKSNTVRFVAGLLISIMLASLFATVLAFAQTPQDQGQSGVELWGMYCWADKIETGKTLDGLDTTMSCIKPNGDLAWGGLPRVCGPVDMVKAGQINGIFGHFRASCRLRAEYTPEDLAAVLATRNK